MKDDYATNSHYLNYTFLGWENVIFELGSEKVKTASGKFVCDCKVWKSSYSMQIIHYNFLSFRTVLRSTVILCQE